MKKRTRNLLFYASVIVFLGLAPVVVLYALGYKYDLIHYRFFKTGSFRVETNESAEVYINGRLEGETGFIGNSFSKANLLPRTYAVRIQKTDYQPWQKLIEVGPGYFSDFPNVILVPEKFTEDVVATTSFAAIDRIQFNVDDAYALVTYKEPNPKKKNTFTEKYEVITLNSGRRVLIDAKKAAELTSPASDTYVYSDDEDKRAWTTQREIWVEWLKDTNYQPFIKKGEKKVVARFPAPILDIQWHEDGEHLIANVGGVLKFIELDTRGGVNVFDLTAVTGPFLYYPDTDSIYTFKGRSLVRISLGVK